MGQLTITGEEECGEPESARLPAAAWQVDKLVRLGVSRVTAAAYTMRQAYAVLAEKTQRKQDEKRPAIEEPIRPVFTPAERAACAATLGETLADHAGGRATDEELYRVLRGVLYVLTPDELVRVGKGLHSLLKGA